MTRQFLKLRECTKTIEQNTTQLHQSGQENMQRINPLRGFKKTLKLRPIMYHVTFLNTPVTIFMLPEVVQLLCRHINLLSRPVPRLMESSIISTSSQAQREYSFFILSQCICLTTELNDGHGCKVEVHSMYRTQSLFQPNNQVIVKHGKVLALVVKWRSIFRPKLLNFSWNIIYFKFLANFYVS